MLLQLRPRRGSARVGSQVAAVSKRVSHLVVVEMLMLGLLLAGLAWVSPAVGLAAADNGLTAQQVVAPHGTRLRSTDSQQVLSMAVALKAQDDAALNSFLQELYSPQSAAYHQYLTPAQFTSRFFDATARAQVDSFLTGKGLAVKDNGVGSLVNFSGTVAQAQAAFGVSIGDYQEASGRIFYSNDLTPALPAALAGSIVGVFGLDNYEQFQNHLARPNATANLKPNTGTPTGCTGAVTASNNYGSYTPNQFAAAYNFTQLYSANFKGQGQTVALFELSDYRDSYAAAFQTCFGSAVPLTRVKVDGGGLLDDGEVEVELDIDVVVGMAPQLGSLLVYTSPNNFTSYLNQYQKIASDNTASVVSSSWGICEARATSSLFNSENTIFQQMAAQGQSIFVASGDEGAEGCRGNTTTISVVDPASQPYVTGVGGTNLAINTDNTYKQEVVWNQYSSGYGAGGGGISSYWAKPGFQTGPGTSNSYSNGKRQVPDVTADGDPYTAYTVYARGSFTAIGGTSAAAPLWAAGTVLVNQKLGGRMGFANPVIYSIFNSAPIAYHDITVGDNCYDPSCGGGAPNSGSGKYPATAGYDQASGVGSFNLGTFAARVAPPPPAYLYNLPFLANNAYNYSSFVAIQNIGGAAAHINLNYYGGNGTFIASDAVCTTLAANAECLPNNRLPGGSTGQGIIGSDQPLNVIVSEATPFGGSAYVVSSGSSSTLIEPFAFKNAFGSFNSLYFIFNAGAATTATVTFYSANGTAVGGATQNVSIAAHAGATVRQDGASGLADGFNGYAIITGAAGSQLSAQVLEYNVATNFAAVANAQPLTAAQATLFAPGIFNNAFGFSTGFNVINPNNAAVTVSITYNNGTDGTALTSAAFVMPPHSVQGVFQGGTGTGLPVAGLPAGFSGSAQISATGGGVLVNVNEDGGVTGTGSRRSGVYVADASGSNRVALPVIAKNGLGFTTGLTILNTSNGPLSGSLQYQDTNGNAVGSPNVFTNLPAHASQLFYQGDLPIGSFYGTAVITKTAGADNSLIVTTNAQSASFFYTYTEPN